MEKKKEMKINLFGTVYIIRHVSNLKDDKDGHEIFGCLHGAPDRLIEIAENMNDKPLSEEEKRLTLLHELFHAFLYSGQYLSCGDDEPLVEWLSRCMNEALKSKVIQL